MMIGSANHINQPLLNHKATGKKKGITAPGTDTKVKSGAGSSAVPVVTSEKKLNRTCKNHDPRVDGTLMKGKKVEEKNVDKKKKKVGAAPQDQVVHPNTDQNDSTDEVVKKADTNGKIKKNPNGIDSTSDQQQQQQHKGYNKHRGKFRNTKSRQNVDRIESRQNGIANSEPPKESDSEDRIVQEEKGKYHRGKKSKKYYGRKKNSNVDDDHTNGTVVPHPEGTVSFQKKNYRYYKTKKELKELVVYGSKIEVGTEEQMGEKATALNCQDPVVSYTYQSSTAPQEVNEMSAMKPNATSHHNSSPTAGGNLPNNVNFTNEKGQAILNSLRATDNCMTSNYIQNLQATPIKYSPTTIDCPAIMYQSSPYQPPLYPYGSYPPINDLNTSIPYIYPCYDSIPYEVMMHPNTGYFLPCCPPYIPEYYEPTISPQVYYPQSPIKESPNSEKKKVLNVEAPEWTGNALQ